MVSRRDCLIGALAGSVASQSRALMVGDPPDSPMRRIDPNTAESMWSGVGSITGGGGVYTGTLIAPRVVITAAHVAPQETADLRFNLNIGGDLSHELRVKRSIRHPAFKGFTQDAPPAFDLALLELAQPAPPEARRYPFFGGAPKIEMPLALVGYGASGNGSAGVVFSANAAIKRVGANAIERLVGTKEGSALPLIYLFTFKRPTSPRKSAASASVSGLASGDSGSPAFVIVNGQPLLFGINSLTIRPPDASFPPFAFGTVCGGQVIAAHREWLSLSLAALGNN